jgi:precorrin-2/cobalt-factor-2 C20-methyltransferase
VQGYADAECEICPVNFSLAKDREQRRKHWQQTAGEIAERLRAGQDVTFVTLGDTLLYSTYIYLIRALRQKLPEAKIETVPGISSFSLAAALTNMPLGEGLQPLQVIPSANDLGMIEAAVASGGGVVLMKIGRCLQEIIALLDRFDALDRSVFVSRAGLPDQRVETDLKCLHEADEKAGNLAVIIVQGIVS